MLNTTNVADVIAAVANGTCVGGVGGSDEIALALSVDNPTGQYCNVRQPGAPCARPRAAPRRGAEAARRAPQVKGVGDAQGFMYRAIPFNPLTAGAPQLGYQGPLFVEGIFGLGWLSTETFNLSTYKLGWCAFRRNCAPPARSAAHEESRRAPPPAAAQVQPGADAV